MEKPPEEKPVSSQEQYNRAFIEWIEALHTNQRQQYEKLSEISRHLNSVRTYLFFFVILAVIGIVVTACSAFLSLAP